MLQDYFPVGGRSRASPDAPASSRCVEVNCAPRPAPHMQTQPHPCSNPLLLAAFPLLFPVALGHPVAMHSLPAHTPLGPNCTYTSSSVTFLSILPKAAQYQAQKMIIKASLAPVDSAVRVVWSPRSGKYPANPPPQFPIYRTPVQENDMGSGAVCSHIHQPLGSWASHLPSQVSSVK